VSTPDRDDLLAAYRAERGPSRAQARRLWARLEADVGAPESVPRIGSVVSGRGRTVAIAAVVLAAAAVAVLALRPSGRRVQNDAPHEPSLAAHEAKSDRDAATGEASNLTPPRRAATPDPRPEPETSELPPSGDPASAPRVLPRPPPRVRKTSPHASEPAATDSLAQETALLRRARAALSEGRPAAAIEVLRDYDRRFSSPRLAEEADAVRTMARCRLSPDDPRALADAFVARHGGSLFRKQVDAACAAPEREDAE
jgi:hypothetical protein